MFSLENELNKRLEIVAEEDVLIERKQALENELNQVNEALGKYDYSEIRAEIAEIKKLMGIDDQPAAEEVAETVDEAQETVVEE